MLTSNLGLCIVTNLIFSPNDNNVRGHMYKTTTNRTLQWKFLTDESIFRQTLESTCLFISAQQAVKGSRITIARGKQIRC